MVDLKHYLVASATALSLAKGAQAAPIGPDSVSVETLQQTYELPELAAAHKTDYADKAGFVQQSPFHPGHDGRFTHAKVKRSEHVAHASHNSGPLQRHKEASMHDELEAAVPESQRKAPRSWVLDTDHRYAPGWRDDFDSHKTPWQQIQDHKTVDLINDPKNRAEFLQGWQHPTPCKMM